MKPTFDRNRDDRPTIAEIAALARRLRELSAHGREADPAERAAFLAEKDALLARITDPEPAREGRGSERELHHHRARPDRTAGAADAAIAGPDAMYDPGDSQWWHPGGSARLDLPHTDAFPPWAQPARAVDPTEPAARAAALHEPNGAHDDDPWTAREGERPVPWHTIDDCELEARREQLASWYHDVPTAGDDAEMHGSSFDDTGGLGWSR